MLPAGGATVGDDVQLAIRLETADGVYGATLTFVLADGLGGLEPREVRVEVMD